jgi:hypothetical protein
LRGSGGAPPARPRDAIAAASACGRAASKPVRAAIKAHAGAVGSFGGGVHWRSPAPPRMRRLQPLPPPPPALARSLSLDKLKPNTEYVVKIQAVNNLKVGTWQPEAWEAG